MTKSRRRGTGEGSIYRRNDGLWAASLTIGLDAKGKQRRRVKYARTRKEAAELLARMQVDRIDAPLRDPSRLKLDAYLERWLNDVSRPRTRETTHAEYRRLARHVCDHLAGISLEKLAPLHIRSLHSELERSKVGARTRQAVHRLLHRALGDAQRMGMVRINAAALVDAPRVPKREARVLTPEQLRKLLEVSRADETVGALAILLSFTGLRIGEALALQWRHVDLRNGVLQVERSLAEVRGRFIVREPKSARSRRRVEIPEAALEALRVYRGRRGTIPHTASLVFSDSCDGYLRRSNVLRREWHPLLKRAGLPQVGFHAVRHGHATALLAAGANPRAIAERLGHSRASLVLDVYGHVIPGAGRELANRIADTLG
jgi:integrase